MADIILIRVEIPDRIGRNGPPQIQIGSARPTGNGLVPHLSAPVLPGSVPDRTSEILIRGIRPVRLDRVTVIRAKIPRAIAAVYG